jgi:hypothetical protein
MIGHGKKSFAGSAAPIAAFMAITYGGRNGPAPESEAEGRSAAEDGEGRLFCFAKQRPAGPAENSRAQPLAARTACRPIAL